MRVGFVSSALSSSVLVRLLTGLGILGYTTIPVYGQTVNCSSHHGDDQHGDSDDDDDNEEDDDPSDSSASAASAACSTASWSHNSSWTWTGTLTSTQTAATSGADNAALSQTTNKLSSGSVAGVVFGVAAGVGLIGVLCYRTRRRYLKQRHLAEKNAAAELGNAGVGRDMGDGTNVLASARPAGTKENDQMMTMGNIAPNRGSVSQSHYDAHTHVSGDYLSRDNHSAYTYNPGSTTLSYTTPSESTGITAATVGHGQSNLHEALRRHQKELEAGYRYSNAGELDQLRIQNRSEASVERLPEHPPPQYHEH